MPPEECCGSWKLEIRLQFLLTNPGDSDVAGLFLFSKKMRAPLECEPSLKC